MFVVRMCFPSFMYPIAMMLVMFVFLASLSCGLYASCSVIFAKVRQQAGFLLCASACNSARAHGDSPGPLCTVMAFHGVRGREALEALR